MEEQKSIYRVNINMGSQIVEWYKERASEMGVPYTSLMVMVLNQYIEQKEAVERMPQLTDMVQMAMNSSEQLKNIQVPAKQFASTIQQIQQTLQIATDKQG